LLCGQPPQLREGHVAAGQRIEERRSMFQAETAEQALTELDAALALMQDVERRSNAGENTEGVYEWMTGDSADLSRTHYLRAVALAVIALAGGHRTREDVENELGQIPPTYLVSYPLENNPDLKAILSAQH
jgi:hypothetical protein